MTRPLLWTTDVDRARRSHFVWLDHGDGRYSLSVLGIINGLLPERLALDQEGKDPAMSLLLLLVILLLLFGGGVAFAADLTWLVVLIAIVVIALGYTERGRGL